MDDSNLIRSTCSDVPHWSERAALARSHLARPSLGCVRGRYKYIFPSTSSVQSPPRVFEGVKQKREREREEGREAKLCSARGIAKLTKDPDSI